MAGEPDLFTNVHKGIRAALFEACLRAGRTGEADACAGDVRAFVQDVLRFVVHHGENEDLLMVPSMEAHLPRVARAMSEAHRALEAEIAALREAAVRLPMDELYLALAEFTARYLDHMLVEERDVDPALRRVLDADTLAGFGRDAVARTAPADQRMMLGFMLPAMTPDARAALLARLPAPVADALRHEAGR